MTEKETVTAREDQPGTAALNTDRELWRSTPGDYYADSIHVTEGGGIGINVGGHVIVKPIKMWHDLAKTAHVTMRNNADERVDLATEDQPRPTPLCPKCGQAKENPRYFETLYEFSGGPCDDSFHASEILGMNVKLDPTMPVGQIDLEDAKGKRTTIVKGEAQGEAPQERTFHSLVNCSDFCTYEECKCICHVRLKAARVESGAHPSQDARAEFEKWFTQQFPNEHTNWKETRYFYGGCTQSCWEAWQAGARSTPSLPAQDATIQKLWELRDDVEMFIQHDGALGSIDYDAAKTFQSRHRMMQTAVQLRGKSGGSTPSPDPPCLNCANLETVLERTRAERNTLEDSIDEAQRERDEWKRITANRDKSMVEQRGELSKAKTERDELRAEVERLREALREIADMPNLMGVKGLKSAARAALAPSLPTKEKQ